MVRKQLTLLVTFLLIYLPNAVLAEGVSVRAGSVSITTTERGGVSVDTGRHGVSVDSRSNLRTNRVTKKRYCVKKRSSNKYRCYYKTVYKSNSSRRPGISSDSAVIESPTYERSSRRVRTDSRHTCRGNGTYSQQETIQSSNSDETYVESSITTGGCN